MELPMAGGALRGLIGPLPGAKAAKSKGEKDEEVNLKIFHVRIIFPL